MSDGESITAAQCRNCDVVFGEPRPTYCPSCGQETAAHPPTVWEFGHEFITHYIVISMLYPLMLITFACLTMLIAIFV